eukprot:GEZU01032708.1.p1 GENE.GEZU01032708.1~~GEZU01032708.1.p1  ORF type:complete len:373 (+),score=228.89 GEZU01032708.1:131-1249(+)
MTTKEASSSASAAADDIPTFDQTLQRLTAPLLQEVLKGNNIKITKSSTKKDLAENFVESSLQKGIQGFFDGLDKETLKDAVGQLEDAKSVAESNNQSKLLKAMKDSLAKHKTFESFLEQFSMETLEAFCKSMEFQEETEEKEELVDAIVQEIIIIGAKSMLSKMTKDYINNIIDHLSLKKSGTKEDLINRFLAISFPHLEDDGKDDENNNSSKKSAKSTTSTKKVEIVQGVTKDQLLQTYYTTELRDWCKSKGLKVTGSRKELIDRIIAFLNGDEKNTKPNGKPKKKKPMSEEAKKRKAKEKRKAKKAAEEAAKGEEGTKEETSGDAKADEKKTTTSSKKRTADKQSTDEGEKEEEKKEEKATKKTRPSSSN